jgi:hypothetical protein
MDAVEFSDGQIPVAARAVTEALRCETLLIPESHEFLFMSEDLAAVGARKLWLGLTMALFASTEMPIGPSAIPLQRLLVTRHR